MAALPKNPHLIIAYLVPIKSAIFGGGLPNTLRVSAVPTLSERDEGTHVLSTSCSPHFGAQQPPPRFHPFSVLTSTAHNHHLHCHVLHTNHTSPWTPQILGLRRAKKSPHLCPRGSNQSRASSPQQLPASAKSGCSGDPTGHSSESKLDGPNPAL